MSRPSFTIDRFPVRLQGSVLLIGVLLALSAGERLAASSQLPSTVTVALGAAAAAVFIGSVLVHELAHAYTARRMGLPVGGIVLSLFGGATDIGEARTPRQEGLVALAGPLASLGIGIVVLPLGWVVGGAVGSEIVVLGALNLLLGVFNLLPGLPLDGGRVARAVLWARSGDRQRATVTAGRVGSGLGLALGAVGLTLVWTGNLIGGLWLAFIAMIIRAAGQSAAVDAARRVDLDGRTAADLVGPDPLRLPYLATIEEVLDAVARRPGTANVLLTEVDRVVGVLETAAVHALRAERPFALAGTAMVRVGELPTVAAGGDAAAVFDAAAGSTSGLVLVVDGDGEPVGALRPGATRWRTLRSS
jgi:Zn-dependent protease